MSDETPVSAAASAVTPSIVRGLWRHLMRLYKTKVIEKRRAPEMYVAAEALARLGIAERGAFMREWATTLGRRVYVPFTIGVGHEEALWNQIVIAVHEHQHVAQYDADGWRLLGSYALSTSARARYETDAYRSNLELHWWRHGELPDVSAFAANLRAYACSEADIEVAARTLKVSADAIRRGAIINEASNVALRWLDTHAPQLAAKRD